MTDALIADLEHSIIFGAYGPGSRITEDRIMERHGAKRHAVRAVFAQLESRGLLVRKQNRGVEVVDFTPDEVDQLYDVRIVLETAAAERTALPCAPAVSDTLDRIARQHEAAVEARDFRAVYELNLEFHQVQYACCGNPMLVDLIERHSRIAQPIRVVKYEDRDHMRMVVAQHFAIIAALRGTSVDEYVRATEAHLPASAAAYRMLYESRFGKRAASA